MIWRIPPTLEALNSMSTNTLVGHLDIKFSEIGDDYLCATMPVDARTVQPFRLLHGGASVALAETIGSVASTLMIELQTQMAVGLEINANHLKSTSEGDIVTGKVSPVRIGRTIHVWNIEITNSAGQLVCVSRITMAVIDRKK